jgi:hypothetical protein
LARTEENLTREEKLQARREALIVRSEEQADQIDVVLAELQRKSKS